MAAVGARHPGRERQPSQWDAGANSPPPGDSGHARLHRLEAVKWPHREAPDGGLMPGTEKEEKRAALRHWAQNQMLRRPGSTASAEYHGQC